MTCRIQADAPDRPRPPEAQESRYHPHYVLWVFFDSVISTRGVQTPKVDDLLLTSEAAPNALTIRGLCPARGKHREREGD